MNATLDQLYALFNNKLCDFFEDLKGVIGNLPDYDWMTSSAELVSTIDPSQNHKLFVSHVENLYASHIIDRNESFFLNNEYNEIDRDQMSSPNMISLLKHIWCSLNDADKMAVWDHLEMLLKISHYVHQKRGKRPV